MEMLVEGHIMEPDAILMDVQMLVKTLVVRLGDKMLGSQIFIPMSNLGNIVRRKEYRWMVLKPADLQKYYKRWRCCHFHEFSYLCTKDKRLQWRGCKLHCFNSNERCTEHVTLTQMLACTYYNPSRSRDMVKAVHKNK
jgi:hypothetical protein